MEESTLVALKPLPAVLEPPLKFIDFVNDASSCSSEEEISFTDTYLVCISSGDSLEPIWYLFGEDLLYYTLTLSSWLKLFGDFLMQSTTTDV